MLVKLIVDAYGLYELHVKAKARETNKQIF